MCRPEYIQLQNVASLFQKCARIYGLFQSEMLKFSYLPHHPLPPHISNCQHVFLLFRMSLRHLDRWFSMFSIVQKFARDLILVDMIPDYDVYL